MITICAPPAADAGFISSVTGFIDCQSWFLGASAYQALGVPGSTLSLVLTGFLTIFIALIGYNLLLGNSFTLRTATLAMVKIGAVFALATSWPAYQTLVYDVVTNGPAEIVSEIGTPSALPGSDGSLVARLDQADEALAQLSVVGPGQPVAADPSEQVTPPPFAGFNAFALGGSRILFLISAVGGLGLVKFITGLLLAVGPFFIAFLMFEGTRSMFEGWVRVLAGAGIGAIGVSVALGLQLAFIEPWLAQILSRRGMSESLPAMPAEMFVVAILFTIMVFGVIAASARLAGAFRLPTLLASGAAFRDQGRATASNSFATQSPSAATEDRSRASVLTDAVQRMQRYEQKAARASASDGTSRAASAVPSTAMERREIRTEGRAGAIRNGSERRSRFRVSATAGRRDRS